MSIKSFIRNKKKGLQILAGLLIVAVFVAILLVLKDKISFGLIFQSLFGTYLLLAENIANYFIHLLIDGVWIQNHEFIFTGYQDYYQRNYQIINNWTSYLLFLKWSAILLTSIWLVKSKTRKKIIYSIAFVLTHFISVVSSLVMIGGIGPLIIAPGSLQELKPHSIGAILMFLFFVIWIKNSKKEIQDSMKSIRLSISLSARKINEILIVFFLYQLLKNIFVPYFNFYFYVNFLLKATQSLASVFGFSSTIDGKYITGYNGGVLYMEKWCLGFITMFVFSAMIYLTRIKNKVALIYISIGIIFLHIVNIVRLFFLFLFVQHNDDSQLIMDHHNMYNLVVYIFIFILWVIWFEKFTTMRKRKRIDQTK